MEKEITAGTILGIVLIALAAVIGIGFGIFEVAKGVSNEGQTQVIDTLDTVQNMTFTDFDQGVVIGNRIFALYDDVKGQPVSILIATMSINEGVGTYKDGVSYTQTIAGVNFLNYNALLANDNSGLKETLQKQQGGSSVNEASVLDVIEESNGVMETKYGFVLNQETGKVEFNTGIAGWYSQGNCEYINSNGKYQSSIIKDISGQIVGVAFSQLD